MNKQQSRWQQACGNLKTLQWLLLMVYVQIAAWRQQQQTNL